MIVVHDKEYLEQLVSNLSFLSNPTYFSVFQKFSLLEITSSPPTLTVPKHYIISNRAFVREGAKPGPFNEGTH